MAITLTRFSPTEHTATLNLGNGQELLFKHISDQQIVLLRTFQSGAEEAQDTTGLPVESSIG